MKKLLCALAAAVSVSSAMADVGCVYTKTKTLANGNLALLHPVYVYAEPDQNSQRKQLPTVGAFFVTQRRHEFIKLADPKYFESNPSYSFAGWAKSSDFDAVAYRNCSAASVE
ncbi:hypothetical protein [Paraburkholderia caribensis]|uniref:hypothetical protein n=1 Tax=Paraburkholderia caribensis TaxID=75105 RepID=UPI000720AC70|nr:hypothetical protein [Paraburkholderia caribensis]ALP61359.1 hypothetical protein AN416_01310 [Paraburkholderia caribensis]AUT50515.1 hypothetical protein C2L66_00715 [Paraburkholderia caribensis]